MKRKGLDRGHAIIFIVPHYSAHIKVRRLSVEQRLWQWWSLLFYFIHLFSIIYLFILLAAGLVLLSVFLVTRAVFTTFSLMILLKWGQNQWFRLSSWTWVVEDQRKQCTLFFCVEVDILRSVSKKSSSFYAEKPRFDYLMHYITMQQSFSLVAHLGLFLFFFLCSFSEVCCTWFTSIMLYMSIIGCSL